MKWIGIVVLLLVASIGISLGYQRYTHRSTLVLTQVEKGQPTITPTQEAFRVSSSAFGGYGTIPKKYTCDGDNVSPPLSIANIPSNATSLALVVEDPDAPVGTFTHWIVWNIAPTTKDIAEGESPHASEQGINSAGKSGYTGPCPPSRHRYFFKLYALDTTIGLDGKANVSDLEAAMHGHIIAESHLIGRFGH